ncbi:MAG: divalent-cation tolerance protein CutA [Fibrobacterota bacterium]
MDAVAVYITCKDNDQARRIGNALVSEHIVACVNIIDAMQSIYWWQGDICNDSESILIAKTRASLFDTVLKRTKELHTYQIPCIVAFPITHCNPDYLRWIEESTLNE